MTKPLLALAGVMLALTALSACNDDPSGTVSVRPNDDLGSILANDLTTSTTASASASATSTTAVAAARPGESNDGAVQALTLTINATIPHSPDAFTQGLLLDDGRLFESTGLFGTSSVREIDPSSGAVLRQQAVQPDFFAEGLALVEDRLIQLTWKAGVAIVYDRDDFTELERLTYDGEGWGLCFDGTRLVMSDGSSTLTFRDPVSFETLGTVEVRRDGQPVERINELECVDGNVWANVWQTTDIVRINPTNGAVTGVVDAAGLYSPADANAVLNGIAHDPATGEFLITGKLWPELYRVTFD